MLPDADVIGFRLGVPYGGMLGHRGLTHSLIFACMVGLAVAVPFWVGVRPWERFRFASPLRQRRTESWTPLPMAGAEWLSSHPSMGPVTFSL